MKVELEVEDIYEFEGKEYEPTGEYRRGLRGEVLLNYGTDIVFMTRVDTVFNHVILRPRRWRAREHGVYYFCAFNAIQNKWFVVDSVETRYECDDKRHSVGNYFKSSEDANKKANELTENFRKVVSWK